MIKRVLLVLSITNYVVYSMEQPELPKKITVKTASDELTVEKKYLEKSPTLVEMINCCEKSHELDLSSYEHSTIRMLITLLKLGELRPKCISKNLRRSSFEMLIEQACIADEFDLPIFKRLCKRIAHKLSTTSIASLIHEPFEKLTGEVGEFVKEKIIKQEKEILIRWMTTFLNAKKKTITTFSPDSRCNFFVLTPDNKYIIFHFGKSNLNILERATNHVGSCQAGQYICTIKYPAAPLFVTYDNNQTYCVRTFPSGEKIDELTLEGPSRAFLSVNKQSIIGNVLGCRKKFEWDLVKSHVEKDGYLTNAEIYGEDIDKLAKEFNIQLWNISTDRKKIVLPKTRKQRSYKVFDIEKEKIKSHFSFDPYILYNNSNLCTFNLHSGCYKVGVFSTNMGKRCYNLTSKKPIVAIDGTSDGKMLYTASFDCITEWPIGEAEKALRSFSIKQLLEEIKKLYLDQQ